MKILSVLLVFTFMSVNSLYCADCPAARYEELVLQGKSAETGREWERAAELYGNILSDCSASIPATDLPKVYDSLSTAQLMLAKYQSALENCERCIALDNRYNACMMTAAKAHEALGDTQQAIESARSAASVEPYDDYSAAVAILATDFLRRYKQR